MYMKHITPEQYEECSILADRALEEIRQKVIGKRTEAWQCGCGEHKFDAAEAFDVCRPSPNYNEHPEQLASSFSWTVKLRSLKTGEHTHSAGLSEFFTREEINEIFSRHFGEFCLKYFFDEVKRREGLGSPSVVWI